VAASYTLMKIASAFGPSRSAQVDCPDDAARRCVHRHRHEARGPRDRLAADHLLARLHQRHGRRPAVLREQHRELRRERQPADRQAGRQLLVLERVDPPNEKVCGLRKKLRNPI